MSSNLLKFNYTYVNSEETRIIDSNELVEKKLEELAAKPRTVAVGEKFQEGSFSGGLEAQRLDDLFSEGEDAEGMEGDSSVSRAQSETPVYTGPSPEDLLKEAEDEILRMKGEAMAALEQEKKRVLDEARINGYQEGSQKAQAEYVAQKQQLEQRQRMLEQEYEQRISELEPELIDTLTGIYEHIFRVDLQDYREILVHLIHTTLCKTEGSRDFIIHVSSEDYPYVSMQKKQILSGSVTPGSSVEIIEDIALGKNECLIETNSGIFDCGLETEMVELTKKLRLLSYDKEARAD